MKKLVVTLALCATISAWAGIIDVRTFDGSGLANGTLVGNLVADFSVTGGYNFISINAIPAGTGNFVLPPGGWDNAVTNLFATDLIIDPIGEFTNFVGYFATFDPGVTLTGFDMGNNPQAMIVIPQTGPALPLGFVEVSLQSATPLAYLTVSGPANSFGIGNGFSVFTTLPEPVPEPGTNGIFAGLLIAGLIACRRKRRPRRHNKDGTPSGEPSFSILK